MKMHKGQVVVYLALVLLAVAIFMVSNVSFFLAVRQKNRLMNAVDEAAIAAAKKQGALLNEIACMNREHLIWAIENKDWETENGNKLIETFRDRPLEATQAAREVAAIWGFPGVEIGAACVEEADVWQLMPYTSPAFYDALASKSWCWFTVNPNRRGYLDQDASSLTPGVSNENEGNCREFSLHVTLKTWEESEWCVPGVGLTEEWTNFVCRVTGKTEEEIRNSDYINDGVQRWAFFDSSWERRWSDTFSPDRDFPIAGPVKDEYDVVGSSARCRIFGTLPDTLLGKRNRKVEVTAEAKPFGTVTDMEGNDPARVTAFRSFIVPSEPSEDKVFTEAHLVIVGSVPHPDAVDTKEPWYTHIKEHIRNYVTKGRDGLSGGCYYCGLLRWWDDADNRASIKDWLSKHAGECKSNGPGQEVKKGGYDFAH